MAIPQAPTPQLQGQVNLPNGGQVTDEPQDVSVPDDNAAQTIPESAAPNTPPSQTPAANAPQPNVTAPSQVPQAPGQPQGPQGIQNGPKQNLPKGSPQVPAPVDPVQAAKQKAVAKASVFHDIAETLSGGPRYTYNVDAYGNTKATKVPVSNAHLALAIAMEAIGGAFTGFANGQGPAGAARAAGASFNQGQQQQQQQDQLARQRASEEFAHRAQVTETNMRMYATARQLGKMDFDQNEAYSKEWEPLLESIQQHAPGYLEGPIRSTDFSKYNVTQNNAIPGPTIARLDGNGKQVEINGAPQWDHLYYVVKPGLKLSDLLTDQDLATAKKFGFAFADNKGIIDSPLSLNLVMGIKSQLSQLKAADSMFDQEFDKYDSKGGNGYNITKDVAAPNQYEDVVNKESKDAGIDPRFTNALISQESGGNPNATSPTGVKGIMQVTQDTGKQYGLNSDADRTDPAKSIHAGTHYFADLLKQFKNPDLAIAAYYSGPQSIKDGKIVDTADHSAQDTQNYVNSVTKKLGLQTSGQTGTPAPNRLSLDQWVAKYPQTRSDIQAFMGAINSPNNPNETGLYGPALAHISQNNPQAAGNIAAFLNQGDPDFIKNHDNDVVAQAEARKAQIQTDALNQRNENKEDLDEKMSSITQSYLVPPQNFNFDPKIVGLDPNAARTELQSSGVKIPTNFNALWDVAHYKAPASILPARTWQKGAPNEMDAQTGISYLQQFINPGYDQKNYQAAQKVKIENASGNSKNGLAIQNAGVASQHLNNLEIAAKAMDGDLGSIRALNQIALKYGLETGAAPVVVYNTILPIATQEVAKVAAGGTVPYKEFIQENENNFAAKNSLAQKLGAIKAATELMYGRINAIDQNTYDVTQEHLNNVPDYATQRFKQFGLDTPWTKTATGTTGTNQAQQQQSQFKPNDPSQYPQVSKDGKYGKDAQGHTFIIATGLPVSQ